VSIRCERDRRGVGQAEATGDVLAGLGHHLTQQQVPLVVVQRGGVEPRLLLRLERHVRPGVVAVRGDVQPLPIVGKETGEVPLVVDHRFPR